MLENDGHWLKLMRTAILPTDANISLRISGGDIICTVTKDVNKEVELKVTCRIAEQGSEAECGRTGWRVDEKRCQENSVFNSRVKELDEHEIFEKVSSSSKVMLDHVSERMTDCSEDTASKNSWHTPGEVEEPKKIKSEIRGNDCNVKDQEEVSSSTLQRSPSGGEPRKKIRHSMSSGAATAGGTDETSNMEVSHNSPGHIEEGSLYKCPLCTFVSMELRLLDLHMKSHRSLPVKRATSSVTNVKSFCEACKIQFMSIDTYHVHKQLYCKSRHERDDAATSPPRVESPDLASAAVKPGLDTVIIRSGINGGVVPSMIQPQAIYAAISTNPLILLPCSLVNGHGLVTQGGVIPTGGPRIVLQSGIACPTIVEKSSSATKDETPPFRKTSHPIMNFSSEIADASMSNPISLRKRKMSEGDVLNLKKSCTSDSVESADLDVEVRDSEALPIDQDIPLDLSLKRKFSSISNGSPPNRRDSVASVECPSPAPMNTSDSGSPPRSSVLQSRATISPSGSYSNDSTPCHTSHVPVPMPRLSKAVPERLSPLQTDTVADKTIPRPGMAPPKLLKQGNNICEECHIVFYKYDNYLAHKKHYCAFRRRQLSALAAAANQEQSSDDNSNHSDLNESAQSYQGEEPVTLRRIDVPVEHFRSVITKPSQSAFCCDACGVKFSTSDTLNAHQTYYCIKRADSAMSKAASARGDDGDSPKSLEAPFSGPEEWKCNYCEATCSSYDTIRRHLLTHSELRGFRCIVCGYKGNTLRGMRSHACEHMTEGSTSIEEFVLSNVIAENGIMPILPSLIDRSDEESDHARDSEVARKRDRLYTDKTKDRSVTAKGSETFESNETSNSSPRVVENVSKDYVPKTSSPIKMEPDRSSPDTNGNNSRPEMVNPLAFCDVVIKTENDHSSSGDDSLREDEKRSFIKFEPEPEYDSDERPRNLSISPPGQSISVIRRAEKCGVAPFQSSKKKIRPSQSKQNSDLKYCKSCDISFYHLSNFLAHKKFYCVSRVIQNCHQEAATVQ